MLIRYGTSTNNIDVTTICLSDMNHNDIITIPSGDVNRSRYFTDPLHGILKRVFVLVDGTIKEFDDIFKKI